MTKIVLCPESGHLFLSTRAVMELVRRGSPGIRTRVTDNRFDNDADYATTQDGFRYHRFYLSQLLKDGVHYAFDTDKRADPDLLSVVEEMGSEAVQDGYPSPRIIEIPDEVEWAIGQCDGEEWIEEVHRTWR